MKIATFILLALLIFGIPFLLRGDKYIGFYYPNADDLTVDIQSPEFSSLEACRSWVKDQVIEYNPQGVGYDYECAKNCDTSWGKPYVCEETTE